MKTYDMNRTIGMLGAAIVTVTVLLFAAFMLFSAYCSYVVCMILPIGYIMMAAVFQKESSEDRKTAANTGLVFAAVYAVLILLVYFAQTTLVTRGKAGDAAMAILDYQKGGLFFSYDLLGYGMMALSTFFIGLSLKADNKADKWLKYLLMIHGVFFIGCFIMPMTGAFDSMASGDAGNGGTVALECWCVYFIPIGILSFLHFGRRNASNGETENSLSSSGENT